MKKILIFVLIFCNIALPETYNNIPLGNYFVDLDDDEGCAKSCSNLARDHVRNSGNETLVSTKGIINKTRYGKLLEGIHKKSYCSCTVTTKYKK